MQMTPRASRPRFLLVEDDIISRGFFKAALETLPADVDTADSLASALARDAIVREVAAGALGVARGFERVRPAASPR